MEALGILANLNLPDIDFQRVVTQLDLLPYITSKLKVSTSKLVPVGVLDHEPTVNVQ